MPGLGHLFAHALARTPDKTALIQRDTRVTYAELDARADRVAAVLQASGVAPETRVALLFDNDHRFVEIYFGVLRAGAVVVPVNSRLNDELVEYIIDHADAQVLVCAPSQVRRAARRLTALPKVRLAVAVGDAEDAPAGFRDYRRWCRSGPATPAPVEIADDAIALQPYTSGSTGVPKGCLLTHAGLAWNVRAIAAARPVTADDRAVTAAPLCHKNAMASTIKPMLHAGATAVVEPGFDVEGYLSAISRHGVTITTGVPAIYRLVVGHPDLLASHDRSTVRSCLVGSAHVPGDLREAMQRAFPHAFVRENYGSTEGGPVSLVQATPDDPGMLSVEGNELRVLDDDGRDCPPGQVGELVLRNPGVTRGYYKNEAATLAALRDGWYHTGDLVRSDDGLRYRIVGRADDMINTGGENVYPSQVEAVLLRHPDVSDATVVGVPHAVKGQVPVAFVVLRPGGTVSGQELKDFTLRSGPAFAHPRSVFLVDALPYSAPGKVDRTKLRAQAVGAR